MAKSAEITPVNTSAPNGVITNTTTLPNEQLPPANPIGLDNQKAPAPDTTPRDKLTDLAPPIKGGEDDGKWDKYQWKSVYKTVKQGGKSVDCLIRNLRLRNQAFYLQMADPETGAIRQFRLKAVPPCQNLKPTAAEIAAAEDAMLLRRAELRNGVNTGSTNRKQKSTVLLVDLIDLYLDSKTGAGPWMKDDLTGKLVPIGYGDLKPKTRIGERNRLYWVKVWAAEKYDGKLLACEMTDAKVDEFKEWRKQIGKQGTGAKHRYGQGIPSEGGETESPASTTAETNTSPVTAKVEKVVGCKPQEKTCVKKKRKWDGTIWEGKVKASTIVNYVVTLGNVMVWATEPDQKLLADVPFKRRSGIKGRQCNEVQVATKNGDWDEERFDFVLTPEQTNRIIVEIEKPVYDPERPKNFGQLARAANINRALLPVYAKHEDFPKLNAEGYYSVQELKNFIARNGYTAGPRYKTSISEDLPKSRMMAADYIRVLKLTGGRRNATRLLIWEDIDMKERKLRWRKANQKAGGGKSPKKTYYLPFNEQLEVVLNRLRIAFPDSKYLFPSPKIPKKPMSMSFIQGYFEKALEESGIYSDENIKSSISLHSLRHYAISQWIAAGINPEIVASWVCHTTPKMIFDVYGHMIPGMSEKAAKEFRMP